MSDKYFAKQINLQANEELIAVLHHHPITYAKQIAVTTVLILGAFFFMFPLFSLGELGVALFCAILLTGFFYGVREFYIWFANACVITSKRLVDVDRKGFFHKIVSDLSYDKILDISYSVSGVMQSVFHLGDIKIQAKAAILKLGNIAFPAKVNQVLADLINEETGKKLDVKKVVSLGEKGKDKITSEFLDQDKLAEYEDYKLDELLAEYKENFGELSLKKLLVDELEKAEENNDNSSKNEENDDMGANFKKKSL
ncbi:MAG: PH domain-containing protein [Candidatus Parcubacteria bacterium]|nr:PH domain-containing protein [Candidatus Parcubacteria bacterium]